MSPKPDSGAPLCREEAAAAAIFTLGSHRTTACDRESKCCHSLMEKHHVNQVVALDR